MGKKVGENADSGLNSNALNPLSFRLVSGSVSKSPCSLSPIKICQSNGILSLKSPTFNTSAGALNDSKKINGI